MTSRNITQDRRWKHVAVSCVAFVIALAGCSSRDDFVAYVPTPELVPLLGGLSDVQLGGWVPEVYADCAVDGFRFLGAPVDANSSGWKGVSQHVRTDAGWSERDVAFATKRFSDRESFDEQWATLETWFAQPCVGTDDGILTQVKPLSLDGLPSQSLTASWPKPAWQTYAVGMSTVIADSEHLTMMFVVWTEGPQALPTDDFVTVVNTAWTEFEAGNS